MQPVDRALTSLLFATHPVVSSPAKFTSQRWPQSTPRYRSTKSITFSRRAPRNSHTESLVWKLRSSAAKPNLSKPAAFIPWLITRLEVLASNSTDPGYTTFIKNLIAILPNQAVRRALETHGAHLPPQPEWHPSEQASPVALLRSLKSAFHSSGEQAVGSQLKYAYHGLIANRRFSNTDLEDQERLADLRFPVEWYPATRTVQRKIVLHVGPTNSGKTYQALKRLEQAKSGIYAGPLRLLAHEIYTTLNAKGKPCSLVTGDEKTIQEDAEMQSCTVEMVPLNRDVEVAVIDEIQFIGHRQRGWAWTQALLGLKAGEIHLCGEERSVPLIRELVASMGDQLEVHTYKRLSPLETMSTSLHGNLKNLRKGDCVVVFSRVGIHAMRRDIEKITQKRVAIVYGSLPPEIRAQQAKLFNDPDNDYDILVASDAIGMGLNLAIKRIVFESVSKFDGSNMIVIEPAQVKQIAGRAGRYRTAAQAQNISGNINLHVTDESLPRSLIVAPDIGLVTTLERADLTVVRRAMQNELDPIMSAGIFPPTSVLIKFATYFPPSTNFSYILLRLNELCLKNPRYHVCSLKDQVAIANRIEPFRELTTRDRIIFCAAPAPVRTPGMSTILAAFARCVNDHSSGALLDIPELPLDILNAEVKAAREYMERFELLHKALILYLWLSYRFAGVFVDQAMAFYVKTLVEEKIDKILAEYSSSPAIRERIRRMREQALRQISNLNGLAAEFDAAASQTGLSDEHFLFENTSAAKEGLSGDSHLLEEQIPGIGRSEISESTYDTPP